jgi:cytochrome c5
MRGSKLVLLSLILLGVGVGPLVACSLTSAQPARAPVQPTVAAAATQAPTAASAASQVPTVAAAPTQAQLAADGAALLSDRCTSCHSQSRATRFRGTASQWGQVVDNMIYQGASLTEAEKTVLVAYLAKTYGQ